MNTTRWSARGALSIGYLVTAMLRVVAADPATDPAGWENLKFGLTRDQVIRVLNGEIIDPDAPPQKESLFGLSSTLDIPALRSACAEILADSRENADTYDPQLLEQCRDLERALGARRWKWAGSNRKISGRLAEVVPSVRFGDGNEIVVATKAGRTNIPTSMLVPADKKVLETAYDAANDLADHYARTGTQPQQAPAAARMEAEIPPRRQERRFLKTTGSAAGGRLVGRQARVGARCGALA